MKPRRTARVSPDVTDVDLIAPDDPWQQPAGGLGRGVVCLIVASALIAIGLAWTSAERVWWPTRDGVYVDPFFVGHAVALGLGLMLVLAWSAGAAAARPHRLAIILPVMHLAALVVGWIGWTTVAPTLDGLTRR